MTKKKKLEILHIGDITNSYNKILSDRTNHYLQLLLFNLRLIFRYNGGPLDDMIEFYSYIEDILNNKIELDDEELKILIYRVTDLMLNIEEYNLNGDTLITESIAYLLSSLYLELETYKLVDIYNKDDEFKSVIRGQIKNQVVEFNNLIDILKISDDNDVIKKVEEILYNNYPHEYARYKARCKYLEY